MNYLLISYRVYEFDGRLRELRSSLQKLGNLKSVSLALNNDIYGDKGKIIKTKNNISPLNIVQYAKFFFTSIFYSMKYKDVDVFVIQDTPACMPAFLLSLLRPHKVFIQDVPELKLREEKHTLYGKIFSWFEEKMIRKSDILICANPQRAKIMKDKFQLEELPIVHENIRILDYCENISNECEAILKQINHQKINIINIGGYSVERGTTKLIQAMAEMDNRYELYIVGGGSPQEKHILEDCIKEKNLTNVHLLGRIRATELKRIVNSCQIGIVNYHKNDLNNYYCASGRVYEYLFEGLPIVTTENLPLKELCQLNGVGEADDDFYEAIDKVASNIETYKMNVSNFMKNISVENNNQKLLANLRKAIDKIL